MLENREHQSPLLTAGDRQVYGAIEQAEGLCIRQVDQFTGFESIVFEDWSQASVGYRPLGHNYRFFASKPGSIIEPWKGPYDTYNEAANVILASLFCLSHIRSRLAKGLKEEATNIDIRVIGAPQELPQLQDLADTEERGKDAVLQGISMARSNLFNTLVPVDQRIPAHNVLTRDDGIREYLSTYQTKIDGVLWRVYKEGNKKDEILKIRRNLPSSQASQG